ncbi:hypothetical protein [Poseidonibacter lekithochrous]|uniref:hypothetical protein n=1 Tax=Poseidonibacter lekithochrous TaxID=1904463 RepID=UPI000D3C4A07|nr:hypothetical protein [Poseidonibacter lekithochrous]
MQINTSVDNSIAFEANEVESKDRSNKELEEQASSFAQLLNQASKSEDISYQTTSFDNDSITTTFEDPTNGKMIAVSLNKDVVSKLEDYFGKDDVYRSPNGTVTLDNKAESYVAGWFEDIAYKRDFLKADANNDGQISRDEYNQTKNNFEATIKVSVERSEKLNVDVEETVSKSYINAHETDEYTSLYRSENRAKSLDDELNMTLSIDKDFNSKVDMSEAYSTNESISKEELLMAHVNSLKIEDIVRAKSGDQDNPNASDLTDLSMQLNDVFSLIIALLLNSDDEKTKNILTKLKDNDGDVSVLNDYEKDIVENILKLKEPVDGKYDINEIDKVMELFKSYELKGDPLEDKESSTEAVIDKTVV